jgi:hypothetical protein
MDRHVVTHGHNFTCAVKDGAGVIATLFNIGGKGSAPQGCAHLFRNGMEKAFENFQLNRITHTRLVYLDW